MLSIVTVTFNNPLELASTLSSIKEGLFEVPQAKETVEVIIVDGGSNHVSESIIDEMSVCCNMVWIREHDNGIYDAMNKGIAIASRRCIMFLNSGDRISISSFPHLLNDIKKIRNFGDYVYAKTVIKKGSRITEIPNKEYDIYGFINHVNTVICHQAMIFRTVDCKANPYDSTLRIVADYDLKYKFFRCGTGYFSSSYKIFFDPSGVSSSIKNLVMLRLRWRETTIMYIRHKFPIYLYLKSLTVHMLKYLRFLIEKK